MVVIIIYCVGYIILLCYLYYFNVLNVNDKKKKNVLNVRIKPLMLGVLYSRVLK